MMPKFLKTLRGAMITLSIMYCVYKRYSAQNLALGKNCSQSSLKGGFYCHLATNGDTRQDMSGICRFKCCTHTEVNNESWWTVDLGDVYDIISVVIYGRNDCCVNRFSNFYIEAIKPHDTKKCSAYSVGDLSNFDVGEVSECHFQERRTSFLNVSCNPGTVGQFLRVRLAGEEALTLCEVEVYGYYNGPLDIGKMNEERKCEMMNSYYQGKLLRKLYPESVIECVLHCVYTASCFAANFNVISIECDLMEKRIGAYSDFVTIDPAWIVYFNP